MMKKIKKNNISTQIINPKYHDNNIVLKFSNFNLKSISIKKDGFTNYHKDIFEIHSLFLSIFEDFLNHFEKLTVEELSKEKHCHMIVGDKKKKCLEILKIYNPNIKIAEEINFFQLGLKNIRFISQKLNENTYELLFLDQHHLIYPDKNYNEKDYKNYTCCMYYLNKKEIKKHKKMKG